MDCDSEEIQNMAFAHFNRIYNQEAPEPSCLHDLQGFPIPELDDSDLALLQLPIELEEIRLATFSLPQDSAPGCDGYHASFFQKNWQLVQEDVCNAVKGFWDSEFLLSAYNKTVITLIPKVDKPSSLQDLRPISLCNVIYKIISKVLANRLKPILQKLIAPNQSAFLQGRLISDNIILAGELMNQIHSSRQGRKRLAALKIDYARPLIKSHGTSQLPPWKG